WLSVAGGRADGARRRAADHDRDHGRIYRQDPLRAQSAAGLFRGRAHAQDRRARSRRRRRVGTLGGGVRMSPTDAPRRIWLVAAASGSSSAVDTAIRDLVVRGRLNATSVMVVAPSFHRSEAISLNVLNSVAPRVAIGLHLTLTAPFRPLSTGFGPLREGAFLP